MRRHHETKGKKETEKKHIGNASVRYCNSVLGEAGTNRARDKNFSHAYSITLLLNPYKISILSDRQFLNEHVEITGNVISSF